MIGDEVSVPVCGDESKVPGLTPTDEKFPLSNAEAGDGRSRKSSSRTIIDFVYR